MHLSINPSQVEDVTVLRLMGRLEHGDDVDYLRRSIKQMLAENKKKILLNLESLTFVDSSGLGALLSSFASAQEAGGDLRLSNPNKLTRETLEKTRLVSILQVYPEQEQALAAFQ